MSRLTLKPWWVTVLAVLGLAWNLFGLVQFFDFIAKTAADYQAMGLTTENALQMANLPTWMDMTFGVGVVGGVFGCVMLLWRHPLTTKVFLASLVAYILLFAGDYIYGVFGMIEGQAMVLGMVVAVAAILYALSAWVLRR